MVDFNGRYHAEAAARRVIADADYFRSMGAVRRWLTDRSPRRRDRRDRTLALATAYERIRNEVLAGVRHRPKHGCTLGCNPIENDCSWPYCGRSADDEG